jgi:signal transduction histidine kinase
MGSTLSTIHILSELARQQAGVDADKTKAYISKINGYSHQMLEAIDDIVWSINPFNDSVQNVTTRMREFGTELLEASHITFALEVDPQVYSLHLPMETRYDYFMIFKEAINNAARHAQCTRVEATIAIDKHALILTIQDNGKGFDQGLTGGGNGLLNMQNRAKAIKGLLDVYTRQGNGTRIRLTVLIAKNWTYFTTK